MIPEVTGETGLRPSVRHGVAPEMVRPFSNVVDHRTTPTPVAVIPDELEGGGEIPVRTAIITPVKEERPAPEPVPEESATDFTPVRGSPPRRPDPPARVIIPQIIEEMLPAPARAAPPVEQEPAPVEDTGDTGAQNHSVQTAVQPLMATEKPEPEPSRVPEPVKTPTVPVVKTGPEQAAAVPPPAATEPREVAEIVRALHAGAVEPVPPEQSDTATSVTVPEPVHAIPDADIREIPESHVTITIPENGGQAAAVPPPAAAEPREVAEILRALHAGAVEPVTPEQSDTVTSGTVPEPVPGSPKADIHGIPEPHVTLTIPENVVQDSVGHPAPEAVTGLEPAATEDLPSGPDPAGTGDPPIQNNARTCCHAAPDRRAGSSRCRAAAPQRTRPDNQPAHNTHPGNCNRVLRLLLQLYNQQQYLTLLPGSQRQARPSLPVSAPQAGVWVRVNSTSNYTGRVGNAGFMQPFSGSGDNFYKVRWSDRPVQVSVQKQDNSGALLAVGIYRNGTLISTSSVTSPMGTVDMLIDPLTARPPGLTASDMPVPITTPFRLENY